MNEVAGKAELSTETNESTMRTTGTKKRHEATAANTIPNFPVKL